MPHRVTSFLRPTSGNFSHAKTSTRSSRNSSVDNSDSEDHSPIAVGKHDLATALKKHHRLSLHFGKSSRDHYALSFFHHGHFSSPSLPLATIDWRIESPPIVFHGDANDSTGALISGLMFLDVREDYLEVDSFTAVLNLHVTQKRPYHAHCHDCQNQYTELETWTLLAQPTVLHRGRHQFPFSALLPGHLPASMESPVVSIAYEFKAEASFSRNPCLSSSSLAPAKFERTLSVRRSVQVPEVPHHSVRVFPPTNIKASAEYSTVVHPNGVNKLNLKLDGLTSAPDNFNAITVWKLKKVTWRLEETITTKAVACKAHAPLLPSESGQDNGSLRRSEVRCLGEKHIHEGWKSDYNSHDSNVELEFDYFVNKMKAHHRDPKFACDMSTPEGSQVTHSLLVELIVSQEHAIDGKTHLATPTGTGRILRMHFNINLTNYPGLGVSWDNETPPVYQDVPPSPPAYPAACPESPCLQDNLEFLDAERLDSEPRDRRSYGFPAV